MSIAPLNVRLFRFLAVVAAALAIGSGFIATRASATQPDESHRMAPSTTVLITRKSPPVPPTSTRISNIKASSARPLLQAEGCHRYGEECTPEPQPHGNCCASLQCIQSGHPAPITYYCEKPPSLLFFSTFHTPSFPSPAIQTGD